MLMEPVRCQVIAAAVATGTTISHEGFQACAGDTDARSWPPHPYSLLSGLGWEWGKIWKEETGWTIGNVPKLINRGLSASDRLSILVRSLYGHGHFIYPLCA